MNNEISKTIENFFETIAPKYGKDEYQFFQEGEIVWTLQKALLKQLSESESEHSKVFGEYPITQRLPLSFSKNNYDRILEYINHTEKESQAELKAMFEKYYNINNSKVNKNTLLLDIPEGDEILLVNFFLNFNEGLKSAIEKKYCDLVFINNYDASVKDDSMQAPEIIIEFKYEYSNERIGGDLRLGSQKGKRNSLNSIINDIITVKNYCKDNENKIGYFILIDEGNKRSEEIERLMEKAKFEKLKEFAILHGGKIHIFKFESKINI